MKQKGDLDSLPDQDTTLHYASGRGRVEMVNVTWHVANSQARKRVRPARVSVDAKLICMGLSCTCTYRTSDSTTGFLSLLWCFWLESLKLRILSFFNWIHVKCVPVCSVLSTDAWQFQPDPMSPWVHISRWHTLRLSLRAVFKWLRFPPQAHSKRGISCFFPCFCAGISAHIWLSAASRL